MGRLKLCVVFPHLILGGGETAMMEVAEGLAGDFELHVCALDQLELAGQPTIRDELASRFSRVNLVRQRWRLRTVLAGADVVLWYGVVNQVPRALLAIPQRPASVRVVHTDREVDVDGFQRRWRWAIDATVCVVPAAARRIPGAVFIPNTCSLRHLEGPAETFFPAAPRRKTLGFLGRLVPLKNVRWLLDNVEEIGCNLLLQALDTRQLRVAELERLAARRGLGQRVRFLPPSRHVGTLLRSVDAVVIASRHEGFPMVAIEAGTLGVPVISTRVGALPELFGDEVLFVEIDGGVPSLGSLRSAIAHVDAGWGELLRRKVTRLCSREAVISRYGELLRAVHDRAAGRVLA